MTKNRAEILRQTLDALASVRVPGDLPAELLLVDNASHDATPAVIAAAARNLPALDVRPLRDESRGKTAALNNAVSASRGGILLFTDDDVRPPADWIEAMCRPILDGRADAVAGAVRAAPHLRPGHPDRPWVEEAHLNWLACTDGQSPAADDPPYLVGANMAFGRHVLAKVPAFDPEIGAGARGNGEDTIFSMQLERAGYRRIFVAEPAVVHHFEAARLTRAAFLDLARRRGELDAYLKHHWFQTPTRFPRLRLAQWRARFALRRLRNPKPAGDAIAAWELPMLEQIALYRSYLRERRRRPCYRRHGLVKLDDARGGPPAAAEAGWEAGAGLRRAAT